MGVEKRADIICKLVIIGDSGVGKTAVMRRFTDDEFSVSFIATIGIDFKIRSMEVREKFVKVQIWDTAGQEKFRSITTVYYRGAKGVIIAYDITNRRSFENISAWMTGFRRWSDSDAIGVLIGNKCDMEYDRVVSKQEGQKLAKKHNLFFSETSAKDSINVEQTFMKLINTIVDKELKGGKDSNGNITPLPPSPVKPKRKCGCQ